MYYIIVHINASDIFLDLFYLRLILFESLCFKKYLQSSYAIRPLYCKGRKMSTVMCDCPFERTRSIQIVFQRWAFELFYTLQKPQQLPIGRYNRRTTVIDFAYPGRTYISRYNKFSGFIPTTRRFTWRGYSMLLFSGHRATVPVYLICSEFGIVPDKPVAHKRYRNSSWNSRWCFRDICRESCKVLTKKNCCLCSLVWKWTPKKGKIKKVFNSYNIRAVLRNTNDIPVGGALLFIRSPSDIRIIIYFFAHRLLFLSVVHVYEYNFTGYFLSWGFFWRSSSFWSSGVSQTAPGYAYDFPKRSR